MYINHINQPQNSPTDSGGRRYTENNESDQIKHTWASTDKIPATAIKVATSSASKHMTYEYKELEHL